MHKGSMFFITFTLAVLSTAIIKTGSDCQKLPLQHPLLREITALQNQNTTTAIACAEQVTNTYWLPDNDEHSLERVITRGSLHELEKFIKTKNTNDKQIPDKYSVNLNCTFSSGETPLTLAIKRQDSPKEAASILLQYGADLNFESKNITDNNRGKTTLAAFYAEIKYAITKKQTNRARCLLTWISELLIYQILETNCQEDQVHYDRLKDTIYKSMTPPKR